MKYLIIGLGNIGPEYVDTRHNIGFMVADAFAKQSHAPFFNMRLAYYTEFKFKSRSIYVIKPTTYMNLSGKAVNYWMQELGIPKENILVIVDDLALPFGTVKLKPKGSPAGHNGLKNIEAVLGSADYPRLRFGIGDNFPKGRQVDYVLGKWFPDQLDVVKTKIDRSVLAIEDFVLIGIEKTMGAVNNLEF
jgi:PTH1 family peptidyl-tRNA hydrolase